MRRKIEVHSLTGESVRVRIELNKVVQDLKLLLKQCFAPASSSSNFHLFLKFSSGEMKVKCGSLEDPIISMKKAGTVAAETEIK